MHAHTRTHKRVPCNQQHVCNTGLRTGGAPEGLPLCHCHLGRAQQRAHHDVRALCLLQEVARFCRTGHRGGWGGSGGGRCLQAE